MGKGEMAEWSIAAVLKTVELRGSGGSNPSLSATQMKNESDEGSFFLYLMLKLACKHVDTKKTNYCICNIFICVAQDARGRVGDYGEIPLSSRLLAND